MKSILRSFEANVGRINSKILMMRMKACIILFYCQGCNVVIVNGILLSKLEIIAMFGTKMAMQGNSSGIGCSILYQEKRKNLILITFDFALLTNPSWIFVFEMISILHVQ